MNERWMEVCFLLSDSIKPDISENAFEKNIIQALRVLNWKQFLNDFDIRPSFQVGASNRITPDFVMKSNDQNKLFVIEIKQPNIPLNSNFQQQLFSYMRYLKLEYGILIGQSIQIFYDGDLVKQEDPILLETIKFEHNNERGIAFVELFDKENFNKESLKDFTLKSLKKINLKQDFKELTEKIISDDFTERLTELIKQDFISEYDGELIDSVLQKLKIEIIIKSNNLIQQNRNLINDRIYLSPKNSSDNYKGTLNENELEKIYKKVPVWFNKPHQKNSQILINFLKLREKKTAVTIFELEKSCEKIENFKSSYQGMKTISERNNAKVFDEVGHIISLWEPGRNFIEKEYEKHLKNNR